jgi:hypothetical protein
MPVPGNPMVPRAPRPPSVNLAPRGPRETDAPDLLKFIVTPDANRMRLKNRNPTGHHLSLLRCKPDNRPPPLPLLFPLVRCRVGRLSQLGQPLIARRRLSSVTHLPFERMREPSPTRWPIAASSKNGTARCTPGVWFALTTPPAPRRIQRTGDDEAGVSSRRVPGPRIGGRASRRMVEAGGSLEPNMASRAARGTAGPAGGRDGAVGGDVGST